MSLYNNAKEIIRSLKNWALKYKSDRNFDKVEKITGLPADWSDADYGEPPAKYN